MSTDIQIVKPHMNFNELGMISRPLVPVSQLCYFTPGTKVDVSDTKGYSPDLNTWKYTAPVKEIVLELVRKSKELILSKIEEQRTAGENFLLMASEEFLVSDEFTDVNCELILNSSEHLFVNICYKQYIKKETENENREKFS